MDPEQSLEKVSFSLALPSNEALNGPERKASRFPWLRQIHNAPLLGTIIERVSQGGKLTVDFDLPLAIQTGLNSGEYIRKGGVIVTAKGHKIVVWLKEGKVVRGVGQAINVVTVFINLWSDYVLDNKLQEIQEQLGRIEEYVRAQHFEPFVSAHDHLKAALKAKDEATRKSLFLESRSSFVTARNRTRLLLEDKAKKIHKELVQFDKAALDNEKELIKIYGMLNEMTAMTNTISHCYEAEARIYERLDDFSNAEQSRVEALNFQLYAVEYLRTFVDDDTSYSKAKLVSQLGFEPRSIPKPQVMGPIYVRAKKYNPFWKYDPDPKRPPDFLEAHFQPVAETLEAIEGGLVGVTFQLQVDQPWMGGLVYLGGKNGLYAVDKDTGVLIKLIETSTTVTSKPAVSGQTVIFGCYNGHLHAVDTVTWEERWTFETAKTENWQDLVVADNTICLSIRDDCLCALDLDSGQEKWRFETKGQVQNEPVISEGTVYFGTSHGKVYAVDLKTGVENWSFDKEDWRGAQVAVSEKV
ncbi:MAG: PQQ-binding-like beta-propeller repeat protein [Desulfomonilaceae bacterium]